LFPDHIKTTPVLSLSFRDRVSCHGLPKEALPYLFWGLGSAVPPCSWQVINQLLGQFNCPFPNALFQSLKTSPFRALKGVFGSCPCGFSYFKRPPYRQYEESLTAVVGHFPSLRMLVFRRVILTFPTPHLEINEPLSGFGLFFLSNPGTSFCPKVPCFTGGLASTPFSFPPLRSGEILPPY